MCADDDPNRCAALADNETEADIEAERDSPVHGPTLYVPPDGGSAYDVVEAEAVHEGYTAMGNRWRGSVDPITGEKPDPSDYRGL